MALRTGGIAPLGVNSGQDLSQADLPTFVPTVSPVDEVLMSGCRPDRSEGACLALITTGRRALSTLRHVRTSDCAFLR